MAVHLRSDGSVIELALDSLDADRDGSAGRTGRPNASLTTNRHCSCIAKPRETRYSWWKWRVLGWARDSKNEGTEDRLLCSSALYC